MPSISKPISSTANRSPTKFLLAFFGFFFLFGSVFVYVFLIRPLTSSVAAKSWVATPCVIVESSIESHSGSKGGSTYSIAVTYRYQFNGQSYTGTRYSFDEGSSSLRGWRDEAVAKIPAGSETTCYVNPADPGEAVIERGTTADAWFGLPTLIFPGIGLIGLIFTIRGMIRRKRTPVPALSSVGGTTTAIAAPLGQPAWLPKARVYDEGSPIRLKAAGSRIGRLLGVLLCALIWNGAISVFVFQIVKGFRNGNVDLCMTIFMIPFVLIGLAAIGGVFYFLLALRNPQLVLTANTDALAPGEPLDLTWDLVGRANVVTRMHVWIEGKEEATYRRGTDTRTDKETFCKLEVIDTADAAAVAQGAASITIPPGTMHSFEAASNKIVWTVHARGEIPRWPDLKEEFRIVVLPRAGTPSSN